MNEKKQLLQVLVTVRRMTDMSTHLRAGGGVAQSGSESDSRLTFHARQDPNSSPVMRSTAFFQVKNVVSADTLSVCPTPVCSLYGRTGMITYVRTLKIL